MIDHLTDALISALSDVAKTAARKCAVFAAIGIVMMIGGGFVIAAIYMALAASFGAIAAATTLGITLVTLGLIALAVMMQQSPEVAIEPSSESASAGGKSSREDDVLFDLLVHSAMTGYATGQGNKSRMRSGFDQMVTDLNALGLFDRKTTVGQRDEDDADRKMAG
ncbi:hypothetical protein P7680_10475 [Thalassospira sp. FZY0004]|uniref:Phage holin family protein n=1 Tax=Thalassospira aquimaris TaxID=3037796 RepID=A0ABT6GBG1_9PROT|nr:hypothetical protein [Thalassospira sp. FZY0004]